MDFRIHGEFSREKFYEPPHKILPMKLQRRIRTNKIRKFLTSNCAGFLLKI
ncbi:hypothetical protein LEP1GSC036_2528 [Leptospira weilii str. 2006001853]|uniref:Uncharacterized protein n=2 Tax=Leptospira weilii TaxID=28184 RepID=A0A828YVX4_9LEPT|nr:hypothetical protein LEP1GSC036_2528 [Leptospira weilii str. 2006001853]EMM70397.1 hypothetical protein LEP1GSC038_1780 [Leptospira weilii str. 2006001855]